MKKQTLKEKVQLLFLICICIVVFILFPFTKATYESVQDYIAKKPEGYRWPQVTDFWFTIVTTLVFASLERAFDFVFHDWFLGVCKEQTDLEERDRRTRKAV